MKDPFKDYKRKFLKEYKIITGIDDLTLQDVYGAMLVMHSRNQLRKVSKSDWSERQFDYLYKQLLDGDNFRNSTIDDFIDAVKQTRYQRTHRKQSANYNKQTDDYFYDSTLDKDPNDDMSSASDELLRNDDVYYTENLSKNFSKRNSLNEAVFRNSALKMRKANEDFAERIYSGHTPINVYWITTPYNRVISCRFKTDDYPDITIVFRSENAGEYIDCSDDIPQEILNTIQNYLEEAFDYELDTNL